VGARVVAYTGDTGPSVHIPDLARDADLFIAEATYPEQVPADAAPFLSSARQAGADAAQAGARRLLLPHLWPRSDPAAAVRPARPPCRGPIDVPGPGRVADLCCPAATGERNRRPTNSNDGR